MTSAVQSPGFNLTRDAATIEIRHQATRNDGLRNRTAIGYTLSWWKPFSFWPETRLETTFMPEMAAPRYILSDKSRLTRNENSADHRCRPGGPYSCV